MNCQVKEVGCPYEGTLSRANVTCSVGFFLANGEIFNANFGDWH